MTKSTKKDPKEISHPRVEVNKDIHPELSAAIEAVPIISRAETIRHHGEMGALLASFIKNLPDIKGLTLAIETLTKQLSMPEMILGATVGSLTDTSPADHKQSNEAEAIGDTKTDTRDSLTSASAEPVERSVDTPSPLTESQENSNVTEDTGMIITTKKSDQTVATETLVSENLPPNKDPEVALENQTLINETSEEPAQEHIEPEEASQLSQPSLEPSDQATFTEGAEEALNSEDGNIISNPTNIITSTFDVENDSAPVETDDTASKLEEALATLESLNQRHNHAGNSD